MAILYIDTRYTLQKRLLGLEGLTLALPIIDMVKDDLGGRLGGVLATDTLDEVIVGVCIFVSI
jgi:hypothetical protein